MIKPYKKCLIVCFVGLLLMLCFHHFISQLDEFDPRSVGPFRISDYTYYIIMVKAFWFKGLGNIYDVNFQQQALSLHIGSQIYKVMPLGITPIALVVWLPFAYVARFSMPLSYTLWSAFSVGVLLVALWNVSRYAFHLKKLDLLPIMLILVTLFSLNTLLSIYLGQTSVLAAGLLINLFYIIHKRANEPQSGNCLLIALLIFILGIKPTYIALGLGLLMIYGRWREALYSVVLILVVLIGVTPMLTVGWLSSYFHQFGIFSRAEIPDVYSWAFCSNTMNIFRSAFRNLIGDNAATLFSFIVTTSVYLVVVGFSVLSKIMGKSIDQLSPLRVTKEQLFILLVGSYLLFTPYAGAYEDVLLLTVFITALCVGFTPPLTSYKSLTLVFFLFVILLHNTFPQDKPLWLLWGFKAVILGYMLNFCRFKEERKECTNPNTSAN